jgi:UDP-glucose 4-epimerase
MKIFVTGGAGYIGSVVVEQLVAAGESVVVFDNLSLGHRAAVHPDAVFVAGDLADRAAIDSALSEHRPDAVMHFASKTLVGESMMKPFLYLGDNVTTGLKLVSKCGRTRS